VRTYATRQDYEPGLVRKFSFREQQTSRPQARYRQPPNLVLSQVCLELGSELPRSG